MQASAAEASAVEASAVQASAVEAWSSAYSVASDVGYQSDAVGLEEGKKGIGRWCGGRVAAWTSADVDGLLSSTKQQRMHQLLPELPFQTDPAYVAAAKC